MPSPPEFSDTLGNVRIVKVLFKIKSEHFPQSDRHIRITAEIKINLECIGKYPDPRRKDRQISCRHLRNFFKNFSHSIGKDSFLGKSHDKIHCTHADF